MVVMTFPARFRLLVPASILALLLFGFFLRWQPDRVLRGGKSQPKSSSSSGKTANTGFHPNYQPGIPKSPGENYTRTVVFASISEEDTAWVSLLDKEPNLSTAVYVVDNSSAAFTVPKNKGHEVMVYLTYIIDHYDHLSDVTMFMHAHRVTWHNNDLMFSDAVETIQRLSSEKVTRDGYMNMRCHLDPGCPDHIHPSTKDDNGGNIPEAVVIGRAWLELFPDATAPPAVLSQPCCGQFALSKARIQALPLDQYIFFRKWLLDTELEDRLSGRVWEYVWQYVFAGVEEFCPLESICYCDGYGICFGSEGRYQEYFAIRRKSRELADIKESLNDDETAEKQKMQIQVDLTELDLKMSTMKKDAYIRGDDPKNRAEEAGRRWQVGEGF
jgi:Protein of unknown function (DUF3431)